MVYMAIVMSFYSVNFCILDKNVHQRPFGPLHFMNFHANIVCASSRWLTDELKYRAKFQLLASQYHSPVFLWVIVHASGTCHLSCFKIMYQRLYWNPYIISVHSVVTYKWSKRIWSRRIWSRSLYDPVFSFDCNFFCLFPFGIEGG